MLTGIHPALIVLKGIFNRKDAKYHSKKKTSVYLQGADGKDEKHKKNIQKKLYPQGARSSLKPATL